MRLQIRFNSIVYSWIFLAYFFWFQMFFNHTIYSISSISAILACYTLRGVSKSVFDIDTFWTFFYQIFDHFEMAFHCSYMKWGSFNIPFCFDIFDICIAILYQHFDNEQVSILRGQKNWSFIILTFRIHICWGCVD